MVHIINFKMLYPKPADQDLHCFSIHKDGSMILMMLHHISELGSAVVECLTRDRGAAGSSLTGVTALWSLSKTHLS